MLYHVLDLLPPDVEELVLATGYKSNEIAAYVAAHPPPFPTRCVPEAEPLGTGGAMKNAADGMSDPFIALNSDVIADLPFAKLLDLHREHGGVGTMTLAEVADTRPYGVAALDETSRITKFVEKPEPKEAPSHWINAGVSIWRRAVLETIPPGRPVSFESDVLRLLLPKGVYGYRMRGFWEDAGTPERLLRAQRLLFDAGRGGKGTIPKGSFGQGPLAQGADGNVRGASFGPYVTLGSGVTVEGGAHVENSVVMDGALVGKEASVVASVVGPSARVGAGHRLVRAVVGYDSDA
jgi:mannose-1-phosphate guanylyltransferase